MTGERNVEARMRVRAACHDDVGPCGDIVHATLFFQGYGATGPATTGALAQGFPAIPPELSFLRSLPATLGKYHRPR